MASAAAHYEKLLARHYTWMLGGDLEGTAARDREMLEGLGVRKGALAVDLGCGPGHADWSRLEETSSDFQCDEAKSIALESRRKPTKGLSR